jgi:hypothetical protein
VPSSPAGGAQEGPGRYSAGDRASFTPRPAIFDHPLNRSLFDPRPRPDAGAQP